MVIIPLNFKFKGNRNYIHGTDMYNLIIEQLIEKCFISFDSKFKISIHQFARNQCDLIFSKESDSSFFIPENQIAEFEILHNEHKIIGYLTEVDRVIDCRIPFNEDIIENLSTIDNFTITMKDDISGFGYSPIEITVLMAKKLHYNNYPLSEGKWIFVKLDLTRLFKNNDSDKIKINMIHNFKNQLTKSEIYVENFLIGYIYFSVKR